MFPGCYGSVAQDLTVIFSESSCPLLDRVVSLCCSQIPVHPCMLDAHDGATGDAKEELELNQEFQSESQLEIEVRLEAELEPNIQSKL